ncbi:hypothetical protein [Pantoea sp. CCBC3-3-1]|uniref:DUF7238 family protein n=1 Tax=Pantoea sp. CCBC3-3-1 TaxID=2490851 RepID=UPI0011BD5724|nr:hypothetical protein [Pantoea sp. CCBC3-3-1]
MKNPAIIAFINAYASEIGEAPTADQSLLLSLFRAAGDDLPIDGDKGWFYTAWRKVDIIAGPEGGSKDMQAWRLVNSEDAALDTVVLCLIEGN